MYQKRWYNKKNSLVFYKYYFGRKECKDFGTYQIFRYYYEFFLRRNYHLGSYYFYLSVFQKWTLQKQQQRESSTAGLYPYFSGFIYSSRSGSVNSCWYYRYYSSSWTKRNNNTYCNSFYTYFHFLLFTKGDKRDSTAGINFCFCLYKKGTVLQFLTATVPLYLYFLIINVN